MAMLYERSPSRVTLRTRSTIRKYVANKVQKQQPGWHFCDYVEEVKNSKPIGILVIYLIPSCCFVCMHIRFDLRQRASDLRECRLPRLGALRPELSFIRFCFEEHPFAIDSCNR